MTGMAKSQPAPDLQAVEAYLAKVPEPALGTLEKVRAVIRAAVPPEATEGISYGIPMFKYKGVLLGFGAFADHCSLFLGTSSLPPDVQAALEKYSTSKGTIRFPLDKPLPATLIRRIVRARVAQNEAKKGSK